MLNARKSLVLVGVIVLSAMAGTAAAQEETYTFYVNRDNQVYSSNKGYNFGYYEGRVAKNDADGMWYGDWSMTDKAEIMDLLNNNPGATVTFNLNTASGNVANGEAKIGAFSCLYDWVNRHSGGEGYSNTDGANWYYSDYLQGTVAQQWTNIDGTMAGDVLTAPTMTWNSQNLVVTGSPATSVYEVELDHSVVEALCAPKGRGLMLNSVGLAGFGNANADYINNVAGLPTHARLNVTVPEPATMSILGVGALALIRRRRQK